MLHLIPQRKQINSPLRFLLKELYIIKTDANKGHFLNQPGSHVISACFSHLSLSQSPQNPHPCPISPYQWGGRHPRPAQSTASRFILCNKSATAGEPGNACKLCVCVIWWQVRLNQAPSGWMRGAQGSGIWGAEWWTGSGQGRRHKALFMCINMLYSSSGRHTYSQLHLFIDRFCTGCMYTENILRLHISDHFSLTFYKDIFRVFLLVFSVDWTSVSVQKSN